MSSWKTMMYLDLINAQAKQFEHDRAVKTLRGLAEQARSDENHELESLYLGCLEKLRTGYDL